MYCKIPTSQRVIDSQRSKALYLHHNGTGAEGFDLKLRGISTLFPALCTARSTVNTLQLPEREENKDSGRQELQ